MCFLTYRVVEGFQCCNNILVIKAVIAWTGGDDQTKKKSIMLRKSMMCNCWFLLYTAELCSLSANPAPIPPSWESSQSVMAGKPTLCSIHCATLSSFLSSRAGPMSCKPMGRPRLDNATGMETAGRPVVKKKRLESL